MSEQPCDPSVVGLHSSKQRWFSEAEGEMQRRHLRTYEGADGARRGPADDLSGSGGRCGRRACKLPAPPTRSSWK